MAIIFLIGSFLMGIGLTKRLFPFTNTAERILWGIILGSLLSVWAGYVTCRILFDVSYAAVLTLSIAIWGLTGLLFYRDLREIRKVEIRHFFRGDNKYLILLLLFFAPIFFYFFFAGMFRPKEDGLYLTATSWYDMALHLAIATSFLYGQNFPPVYTVFPTEPLRYPFLPDFHITILMKLGLDIWPSFAITSFVMAIALVGIFYCFARRLADSKLASVVATLLFFFNGGLGFLLFFRDWRQSNESLFKYFWNMKENYTDIWSQGIRWTNLITSGFIPQRAMLYGMPVTFIVLTLIAIVWRNWSELEIEKRWEGSRILFSAGIITGLLPLYHTHSYVSIGFISCFLFLVRPRVSWLAFWTPAALLAIPQVLDLGSHLSSGAFLRFHLGWVSYLESNFFLFMIRNFGLPLLLIFPAYFAVPTYLRTFYIPFVALMVFCFLFIISPNDYDNLKLMYYWYSVTAVILSVWLCRLLGRPKLRFLVFLIILCCTASGALTVPREAKLVQRIFSPEEIEAGNFARDSLPPKVLFLSGQYHNQPVLCLAGKPIVLGYDFWIISHGYDTAIYEAIKNDVRTIYDGGPDTGRLLEKYKVDYIYIGPHERTDVKANVEYFDKHYAAVFKNKDITIYDARKSLD